MIVVWLFLAVPWACLQLLIVVFPGHTYLLFYISFIKVANIADVYFHHSSTTEDELLNTCFHKVLKASCKFVC